jgi:hypothetical protein
VRRDAGFVVLFDLPKLLTGADAVLADAVQTFAA